MLREGESYGKQTKTSSPQESFTLVKHECWDLWTVQLHRSTVFSSYDFSLSYIGISIMFFFSLAAPNE